MSFIDSDEEKIPKVIVPTPRDRDRPCCFCGDLNHSIHACTILMSYRELMNEHLLVIRFNEHLLTSPHSNSLHVHELDSATIPDGYSPHFGAFRLPSQTPVLYVVVGRVKLFLALVADYLVVQFLRVIINVMLQHLESKRINWSDHMWSKFVHLVSIWSQALTKKLRAH